MKRTALLLLLLLSLSLCFAPAGAKQVVNLNRDWKWSMWSDITDKVTRTLSLPHTWNRDAADGDQRYYRGTGVYTKELTLGSELKGKYIYVHFKGANTAAYVYLNNVLLFTHKGGYTAFTVDLTDAVIYGGKNTLVVRLSNALDLGVMPLVGDFNFYGGLYRDVQLFIAEDPHISPLDFGSSGLHFDYQNVSSAQASFQSRVELRGNQGTAYSVTWNLTDASKAVAWTTTQSGKFESKGTVELKVPGAVSAPHLWDGLHDPYLYTLTVTVRSNNVVTDVGTHKVGFRWFSVDKSKGFFLNGKSYPLHGVSRHQDRAIVASQISRMDHREDLSLIVEMGANVIRLSHYPHDHYVMELSDEMGLILWSEIPFIGQGGYTEMGYNGNDDFESNGRQQLVEMIRQQHNHPSVCFWGLFNELTIPNDRLLVFIRDLNAIAHKEDPSRLTVAASNQENMDMNTITDLIAFNLYNGWYGGKPEDIGGVVDSYQSRMPSPVGISEYGAGASIRQQQENISSPAPTSMWHPENYQLYFHQRYYGECMKRPFLWATFIWNMFDFMAAHRREGEVYGLNDKGLVTLDRHVKKDAFYMYKALWNTKDAFVYITERRLESRSTLTEKFQVFSNQKSVELFMNGKSLGAKEGVNGAFVWEGVSVSVGSNTVSATSGGLSDSYAFTVDPSIRYLL